MFRYINKKLMAMQGYNSQTSPQFLAPSPSF